jgi:hypothetical protein
MLTGCGNPLSARTTFQVVSKVVSGGIFGKVIFDPVWAYCCADWTSSKLEALKSDFANIATQRIVERIISSADAKGFDFECEPNEPQERCRARIASVAEYEFNIYANDFVSALNRCRDDVVLNADTGAMNFMYLVPLINQCVANAGYQKEIAMINTKIAARQSWQS